MSDDNLSQLLANVKGSPTKFYLQSDETTDVANLNQLYLHVILKGARSRKSFCSANSSQYLQRRPMKKKILDGFYTSNGLSWSMVSSVCIDGVPVGLV